MLLSSPCLGTDLEEVDLNDELALSDAVDLAAYAERRAIALELKTPRLSLQSQVRIAACATTYCAPCSLSLPSRPPLEVCRADAIGILHLQHPYRSAPLAEVGPPVQIGDPVALLRIGPRYWAVRTPFGGILRSFLLAPGALVGYGTPLVEIQTEVDT